MRQVNKHTDGRHRAPESFPMSSPSSTGSLLINRILSTVRRIFSAKGHSPSPQSVESVVSIVNQLTLDDLDIRQEDMTFSGTSSLLPLLGRRLPTARVAPIYEDNIFSAAVFILRSGQVSRSVLWIIGLAISLYISRRFPSTIILE